MALRIEGTTPGPGRVMQPDVPVSASEEDTRPALPEDRADLTLQAAAIEQENRTASESRVDDVEKAAATVDTTRLQILQQASTSMLAQANMSAAGVLSLLR